MNGSRWNIPELADILIANINNNKLNHIAKSIKIVDNSIEIFGISALDNDDVINDEHHKELKNIRSEIYSRRFSDLFVSNNMSINNHFNNVVDDFMKANFQLEYQDIPHKVIHISTACNDPSLPASSIPALLASLGENYSFDVIDDVSTEILLIRDELYHKVIMYLFQKCLKKSKIQIAKTKLLNLQNQIVNDNFKKSNNKNSATAILFKDHNLDNDSSDTNVLSNNDVTLSDVTDDKLYVIKEVIAVTSHLGIYLYLYSFLCLVFYYFSILFTHIYRY